MYVTHARTHTPPHTHTRAWLALQALLKLLSLSGLASSLYSFCRFLALLLLGSLLYVVLLGVVFSTLGCCLLPFLGALVVSAYRVVFGAWRAGGTCMCVDGGGAGQVRHGTAGGGGRLQGMPKPGPLRVLPALSALSCRGTQPIIASSIPPACPSPPWVCLLAARRLPLPPPKATGGSPCLKPAGRPWPRPRTRGRAPKPPTSRRRR